MAVAVALPVVGYIAYWLLMVFAVICSSNAPQTSMMHISS